jgi:hypothetical protein
MNAALDNPEHSAAARKEDLAVAMAMEANAIEAKRAVVAKLIVSTPVEISGREITPSEDLKEYRKNALEYGKTLRGYYTNKDDGKKILLPKTGIAEVLHHDGANPAHIQSIAAIPQIIERGIYVDTIENENMIGLPQVKNFDYYVAGLKIGGVDYTVKAAITVDRDGNRYYDHALTEIEKRKLLDEAARLSSSPRQQGDSLKTLDEAAQLTSPPLQQDNSLHGYKDKRLVSILQAPISFSDKKNIKNATGWERGADGEWHHQDFFSTPSFEQGKGKEAVAGYKAFEVKPELGSKENELTEIPMYNKLHDLNNSPWKRSWESQAHGETIVCDSAMYKGILISSVETTPFSIMKPLQQFFEVEIYGEENRQLPEYKARIFETSAAFEVNGKTLSYVRFEHDAPLEMAAKFIEDFQNGKLQGLYTQETLEKITTPEATIQANNSIEQQQTVAPARAEQAISYAALTRRWHEKDISEAISFVGQGRQVDVTSPEAVRRLSFLEAHSNLLTEKEATAVLTHVNGAALKEQYPFLHERVAQRGKSFKEVVDSAYQNIEAITKNVKERQGGQWDFDSIARAKKHEAEVMQSPQLPPTLARFHDIRINNNRDIAYQLNQTADIKVFVEAAGYKPKGSTERWPRYERGDSVLLVTEHNTVMDVKSGESRNLFAFIKGELPNTGKKSDTAHFIDTVMKYPESERGSALNLGRQQQEREQRAKVADSGVGVKKEFRLSGYRLEPLNTGMNYLHNQRGIDRETLEHPNFKGAILQGNKLYRVKDGALVETPKWQNNVIYPFKRSPDAPNKEMSTLQQQYGKEIQAGDKMVNKLFAPGNGRHNAAWFSNPPAKVEHLFVMENPLDALSHYQLHKPENALYMATGGRPATTQLALIDEVCQKYSIPNKHLAFDNDMAGHSFDARYLASKTPKYGIGTVPNSSDKEFVVEYRQLKPEQYAALHKAAKDNPNTVCKDDGSISVRVKTPEELSRCNKYAAKFLAEDKTLRFTKSEKKDFNDDLKAKLLLGKVLPLVKKNDNGLKM